ncbi:hypothetical protein QBC44DRAFT_337151 [Cladorrhinum sp. PSN332]|nr:hypothetical protein QBC44DRAFT_337151 [Cladorrhinum sp. PSN332]
MAQHNSSVSVIDTATAQPIGKKHGKLPIRSTAALRSSAKSHSTLTFSSQPTFKLSHSKILLKNPSRSFNNYHQSYRSRRKTDRARKLFLIKRHLWKTSRQRSSKMDWIEKVREIQANESSGDEDFTFMSTSSRSTTSSDGGDRSVASEASTAVTTPNDSDNEGKTEETKTVVKVSFQKKAAKSSAATMSVSASIAVSKSVEAEMPKISKKAEDKATIVSSTKVTTSEKKSGKRKLDDAPATSAAEAIEQQPATKKSKREDGKAAAAAALAQQLKNQGPLPQMSSAIPAAAAASAAAPSKKEKPHGRDFQPVVAAMLDDPLGFEDYVHDDNRKPSKMLQGLRAELASYHKYQRGPKLELVMSGALGPTPPERFEAVRSKSGKLESCYLSPNRKGGSRVNLRPKAGYQGKQHQQQQQYGKKGKQQNHSKYKKRSRF